MDKSWMGVDRTTSLYAKGVESFMKFAIENANDTNLIRCPCTKCGNMRLLEPKLIKCHLFTNGIFDQYTTSFWHGESCSKQLSGVDIESEILIGDCANTMEMVDTFCDSCTCKPDAFVKLLSDAEKPLLVAVLNFLFYLLWFVYRT